VSQGGKEVAAVSYPLLADPSAVAHTPKLIDTHHPMGAVTYYLKFKL
jgi:hypothetical protein